MYTCIHLPIIRLFLHIFEERQNKISDITLVSSHVKRSRSKNKDQKSKKRISKRTKVIRGNHNSHRSTQITGELSPKKLFYTTHHVKFVVSLSSTDVSSDVCGIHPNGCCVPANSPIEINNNNNNSIVIEAKQTKQVFHLGFSTGQTSRVQGCFFRLV